MPRTSPIGPNGGASSYVDEPNRWMSWCFGAGALQLRSDLRGHRAAAAARPITPRRRTRLDGTTITAASFSADLTTLQSDNPMRDCQLSRQALETATYPQATFVLTEAIDLGSVPADGSTFDVTANGDLTVHVQTRSVQVPLQAKVSGGVVTVVGSLDIAFADFGIASPQSMMVLSVADHGVMEIQLHFART
jgi:hypothetical protein